MRHAATSRSLPHTSKRAGLILLRQLADGDPVTVARLARALGTPTETADRVVRESVLSPFVDIDDDGRIQGFLGLSVTPMPHRITFNGRSLWAWCAPDTLQYPELLDVTAEIETSDPETGQLIHLTVSPAGGEAVEPVSAVSSWRSVEVWDSTSAVQTMTSACHYHHFFASRESALRWVAKQPDSLLLSLDEVAEFVSRFIRHMFGLTLTPGGAHTVAIDALEGTER